MCVFSLARALSLAQTLQEGLWSLISNLANWIISNKGRLRMNVGEHGDLPQRSQNNDERKHRKYCQRVVFFNRDLNGLVCWVWASFFLFGEHRGKRLFPVQTLSENKKIENLVHFTELAYPWNLTLTKKKHILNTQINKTAYQAERQADKNPMFSPFLVSPLFYVSHLQITSHGTVCWEVNFLSLYVSTNVFDLAWYLIDRLAGYSVLR